MTIAVDMGRKATKTNKQTNQTGFLFCHLGLGGIRGLWGCPGGQFFFFSKHGQVAYPIDGYDE